MGATIWYYAKDNQQQGPISEDELRLMFTLAQLPPETLVWSQGMANWAPASEVQVFSEAIQARAQALPPPLPPMPPAPPAATPGPLQAHSQPATVTTEQVHASSQPATMTTEHVHAHAAPQATEVSGLSGDMNFESKFSWQDPGESAQQAPAPDSNGAEQSKWGDLDAIPTPGAASPATNTGVGARTEAKPLWDRSALDAIPSPGSNPAPTAEAIHNPFDKSALDAIPTPGSSATTSGGIDNPFDRSALDTIPTHGTSNGGNQGSYDLSELESIPTPKAASASGFDPAALDAIPTPKASEQQPRPQGGLSSLRAAASSASSSSVSLIRGSGDTGSHQRSPKPSLSDLRQSTSMRNPGVQKQEPQQQPDQQSQEQDQGVVNKLRSGLMKFLGKQDQE